MSLSTKLSRPVRAAEVDSDDESYDELPDVSSPSVLDTGEGGEIVSSESEGEEDAGDSNDDEEDQAESNFQEQLRKVSFGALAKAQESLSKQQSANRKRKRDNEGPSQQTDKLKALRERLREIKATKAAKEGNPTKKVKTSAKHKKSRVEDDDSESDSDAAPHARSSKHAPAVQSSRRAVTRKRQVIEVKKPQVRDPRFDSVAGPKPDENVLKKRYAFLKDYKASEMAELRGAIKNTKNESEKEILKRKLLSMESQKKAEESKEKRQEILRDHRKKEKELIKEGKQPFYLKKSEQKKLALVEKFKGMKPKEREKLIERRRKKATAKERKNMPDERRAG